MKSATLQGKAGPPTIMINPVDAQERGLENGETVRVFNDRGDVYVFAQLTQDTPPGVLRLLKVCIGPDSCRSTGESINLPASA